MMDGWRKTVVLYVRIRFLLCSFFLVVKCDCEKMNECESFGCWHALYIKADKFHISSVSTSRTESEAEEAKTT